MLSLPLTSADIIGRRFVNIDQARQYICNSYTMGCPPVRGDNPQALASGLSYAQVDNPWYNYFIQPTSV